MRRLVQANQAEYKYILNCSFQGTVLHNKNRIPNRFLVLKRPEHTRSHPEHEGKDG